jgi:hypothetical protein
MPTLLRPGMKVQTPDQKLKEKKGYDIQFKLSLFLGLILKTIFGIY